MHELARSNTPLGTKQVTDIRLLKATPKGRKTLISADNSDYAYADGVRLLRTLDETTVFVASSPMLFGWFESFALQNLQAFSKYEVTKVSKRKCTHFVVRIYLYFIYERIRCCVGFQIFPSIISLNSVKTAAFKPLSFNHFCTLLSIKCFVSNFVFLFFS